MKHIVYIITKLELGGAQKVCLSLFKGVPQDNLTTSLMTGAQGILVQDLQAHDSIILLNELKREIGIKQLVQELRVFAQLVRHLRKLKKKYPELIVHTHSTKAGLLGRWAALCAGITHRIHTIHGYGFHEHQSWFSWIMVYALELITAIITTRFICVSYKDYTIGLKLFPFFKKKSLIIRASVDEKKFLQSPKMAIQAASFIIGTIACFKPQKNMVDLLRAFKVVYAQHPHARLEIIGDGILRPQLEAWITQHQLNHVITLHGWQTDVAPFLQRWNLFALSSLWEGLPCSIIEARLCKLPVVAYDTGGICEVIIDGTNGFIVPQHQYAQLASRINQLIDDHNLYQKFADYHDNLVSFYEQSMIDAHKNLYSTL